MSKNNGYLKLLSHFIEHELKGNPVLKKIGNYLTMCFWEPALWQKFISELSDFSELLDTFVHPQGNTRRSQTSMDLLPDALQGNTGVPRKHKPATAELSTTILIISHWPRIQHWRPLLDSISNMLIDPQKLDIMNISFITRTLWHCTLAC